MAEKEEGFVKEITPKSQDFSQWYVDVILKAELADYAPVKGCMVIRSYGYAVWENIQRGLDRRIKATGHSNAYFPLFIPESLLRKESEHVEGFAPEVAWVTHGGGEELAERLVVRPTSETMICTMYSKWINSWRDLPVLLNQWCNVVRWEKTTRPFLRTTEFLWQEGHTAHRTEKEAEEETLRMLNVYVDFIENDLAIPVIPGKKTEREKFAGAMNTYSIEALMTDGKALQAGTSHNLGQNFARVFDITFLDTDDKLKHVWQTSWGVSTRLIGALIMVHGDDRGLAFPPEVAPIQVVIVPIMPSDSKEVVLAKTTELRARLEEKYRVKVDARPEYTPGWKFNEWEMRGVPLRLEVGPRDIKAGQVVLVRRDTGTKATIPEENLESSIRDALTGVQKGLFEKARKFLADNTHSAAQYEELKDIIETTRGFVRALWCGKDECETFIKEDSGATIRCIPLNEGKASGRCIRCGEPADTLVYFARAY